MPYYYSVDFTYLINLYVQHILCIECRRFWCLKNHNYGLWKSLNFLFQLLYEPWLHVTRCLCSFLSPNFASQNSEVQPQTSGLNRNILHLSQVIIWPIFCDNSEMVRDDMSALLTNSKSHTGFCLMPNWVILNDLEQPVTLTAYIDNCIKCTKARPTLSVTKL